MLKLAKTLAISCAAAVLFLPCIAKATIVGSVEITNTGYGANTIVDVWGGGYSGTSVYAGVYMLDKTYGTGEGKLWYDGPIGAFCTELNELPPDSILKYNVITLEEGPIPTSFLGGPMGTAKADYIRELWGRFYDPSWFGSDSFTWKQNSQAGAFAAAIWEIVYEDLPASPLKWDVTVDGAPLGRGFRCDYVDADTANIWLHMLDGTGPKADLRVFSYNGNQDYIVAVPEPATIALLSFGSVLGLLHRKRRAA